VGCGCDDSSCEYSRLRDGYEIAILTTCPDQNVTPPSLGNLTKGGTPDCPACPDQPWVVLGAVQVASDGTILSIDNCKCRRIVISFGDYWRTCQSGTVVITNVSAPGSNFNPQKLPQGSTIALTVTFDPKSVFSSAATLQADLGPGVTTTVNSFHISPPSAVINAMVAATAAPGPRTLTVTTSDGAEASLESAINIVALPATPAPAPAPKKTKSNG
jgi:hypothetical protein